MDNSNTNATSEGVNPEPKKTENGEVTNEKEVTVKTGEQVQESVSQQSTTGTELEVARSAQVSSVAMVSTQATQKTMSASSSAETVSLQTGATSAPASQTTTSSSTSTGNYGAINKELEELMKTNPMWKRNLSGHPPYGRNVLSYLVPKDATSPRIKRVDKDISVKLPTDQLNHFFECQICYSIINDTRCIKQCLHRFCQECMEQSLRVLQNECPSCRARVPSRRSCQKDERFDALISLMYPDREKYEAMEKERLDKITAASREHTSALAQGANEATGLRRKRTSDSTGTGEAPSPAPPAKRQRHTSSPGASDHNETSSKRTKNNKKTSQFRSQTESSESARVEPNDHAGTSSHGSYHEAHGSKKHHQGRSSSSGGKHSKIKRVYVSFQRHSSEPNLPDVSSVTFLVPVDCKIKSLKRHYCKRFKEDLKNAGIPADYKMLDFMLRFDNKAVTDVLDDSAIVEDAARSEGCELIPEKTRIVILYMRRR